jgi:hypothetical protein
MLGITGAERPETHDTPLITAQILVRRQTFIWNQMFPKLSSSHPQHFMRRGRLLLEG